MPTEREEAVLLFFRDGGELQVGENEEYARVYLEMRGPDRWFASTPSRRLEGIKRGLYPMYLVPVPNRNGYWMVDATRPVSITSFDDYNPAVLSAQLSYLVSQERTALDFTEESGQAVFDHISGALLDYARLQDDYNQDLASAISKEFLTKDYLSFVSAVKPIIGGNSFRPSPYKIAVSERINPAYSWDEAFKLIEAIEKRTSFMIEYFHRCNGSMGELDGRVQEFGNHVTVAKGKLSKEFDDFKALKGREEVDIVEQCDSDKQDVEKTYKPQLSKAEKQLKGARESSEAAQIELMPVQSVYDEMLSTAKKLQESIDQSVAARNEASGKAEEFRAKYNKLQEDQSNIQARSTKASEEESVPEDTPLDAEMAYLERQALGYESKKQQLDEELKKLNDDQAKGKAELEKFEKSYRPIKEKADEAKHFFENKEAELEELRRRRSDEIDAIEKKRQGGMDRIRSEVAGAEVVLGHRLPSVDKSFEVLKSSTEKLKVTMASALKYADENIQQGIEAITLSGGDLPRVVHYAVYVGEGPGVLASAFVTGRVVASQNESASPNSQTMGHTYSPGAIDLYVQSRLPSVRWDPVAGDFNLFNDMEFKGRLFVGFKEMAIKGSITQSKMLKLAKEVAGVGLTFT